MAFPIATLLRIHTTRTTHTHTHTHTHTLLLPLVLHPVTDHLLIPKARSASTSHPRSRTSCLTACSTTSIALIRATLPSPGMLATTSC